MKIALAVWNGRISPLFDVSRQIVLLDIENGIITGNSEEIFADDNPLCRVCKLADLKVHTLICGAISLMLAGMLTAYKIRIIPFIAGELDDVIAAYLNNRLPNPLMSMPGCCRQRNQNYRGNRQQIKITPETIPVYPDFQQENNGKISKRGKEKIMPKGNQKGTCRGGGGQGSSQGKGCGQGQGSGKGCGQGGQGRGQGCGQGQGISGSSQKQNTGQSPDNKNP